MVETRRESVELYVLENRIIFEGFVRENIKRLDSRFPNQVGAAQRAAEILFRRDSVDDQYTFPEEQDEYNKIKVSDGFAQSEEEAKAFRSVFYGLATLRSLASSCPSDDLRRLSEELGLIV